MHTDDILSFLEAHPGFLQRHADRLGLRPNYQDRTVISLADRQMLELKNKIRQLEARLTQWVHHGKANDLLQSRTHQLTLALLTTRCFDEVVSAVKTRLEAEFALRHIVLRLWHREAEQYPAYFTTSASLRDLANNIAVDGCRLSVNDEIISYFPAIPVLKSFSQLALRDTEGKAFGILVLASDDPDRFAADMHTHYLAQIGELIAVALLRVLTPDKAARLPE